MSYGQIVKCLLQHPDCFGKIVYIQAGRGLKHPFLVTVDLLHRDPVLGETLSVLLVLIGKDGCLDCAVLKDLLRFIGPWCPSFFVGPSGMPLQYYSMGANAISVSPPQPLVLAKAWCAG